MEMIVATSILSFATFGILGVLKLSDQMAYRARSDSKASQVFKSRCSMLVALPASYFIYKVKDMASLGGSWEFSRGVLPRGDGELNTSSGQIFPFFEVEDADAPVYFFQAKPLPGEQALRSVYPYREELKLTFKGLNGEASSAIRDTRYLVFEYSLIWFDTFSGKNRALTFKFAKSAFFDYQGYP